LEALRADNAVIHPKRLADVIETKQTTVLGADSWCALFDQVEELKSASSAMPIGQRQKTMLGLVNPFANWTSSNVFGECP